MDIASWYEINVSKDGRHLFATAKRSITNKWDLERVFPIIKRKFAEEFRGYHPGDPEPTEEQVLEGSV